MNTSKPPAKPEQSSGHNNRLAELDGDIYDLSEPAPGADGPDSKTPWPRWQGRLAGLPPGVKLTASGTATALFVIAALFLVRSQMAPPSGANAHENGPRSRSADPAVTVDVYIQPDAARAEPTGKRDSTNSVEPAVETVPTGNPSPAAPDPTVRTVTPSATAPTAALEPRPTTGPEAMVLRRVGLNYFVLKSTRDRTEAERFAQRARERGTDCTVEGPLPGFTRDGWYSVVTLRGYDLPRDRDAFAAESRRLRDSGQQPAPYKWR